MTNPRGRPSDYNQDIADIICDKLILGNSLRSIAREETMPSIATVYKWIRDYPDFLKQYERAREDQVDTLADELIDISDDSTNDYMTKIGKDGKEYETVDHEHINRSRLRVDTRKWIAERMKPTKYGPKGEMKHTGDKKNPIVVSSDATPEELSNQINQALAAKED